MLQWDGPRPRVKPAPNGKTGPKMGSLRRKKHPTNPDLGSLLGFPALSAMSRCTKEGEKEHVPVSSSAPGPWRVTVPGLGTRAASPASPAAAAGGDGRAPRPAAPLGPAPPPSPPQLSRKQNQSRARDTWFCFAGVKTSPARETAKLFPQPRLPRPHKRARPHPWGPGAPRLLQEKRLGVTPESVLAQALGEDAGRQSRSQTRGPVRGKGLWAGGGRTGAASSSGTPSAEHANRRRSHADVTFTFGLNYGRFGLRLSKQLG